MLHPSAQLKGLPFEIQADRATHDLRYGSTSALLSVALRGPRKREILKRLAQRFDEGDSARLAGADAWWGPSPSRGAEASRASAVGFLVGCQWWRICVAAAHRKVSQTDGFCKTSKNPDTVFDGKMFSCWRRRCKLRRCRRVSRTQQIHGGGYTPTPRAREKNFTPAMARRTRTDVVITTASPLQR